MCEIEVLVVDDHAMFRKGIVGILERCDEIVVLDESDSVEECLRSDALSRADVLILDISLGEEVGLDFIPDFRRRNPGIFVLILSMHNKPILIKKAINDGADGYVVKDSSPEILLDAVRALAEGKKYLDPNLSDSLFLCLAEGADAAADGLYNRLTPREQEVFMLLARGWTSRQIGAKLQISRKTADNHKLNIMGKLELAGMHELMTYADDLGVL